jgi:hypothetical protein
MSGVAVRPRSSQAERLLCWGAHCPNAVEHPVAQPREFLEELTGDSDFPASTGTGHNSLQFPQERPNRGGVTAKPEQVRRGVETWNSENRHACGHSLRARTAWSGGARLTQQAARQRLSCQINVETA